MNKNEFLNLLQKRLNGLPQTDIERSLEFYGEMIEDRIEEGMTEQQAVEEIGSVDEAVTQILSDTPLQRLLKEKARPSHKLRAWEIVLLALGSPIWASLLLAAVWGGSVIWFAPVISEALCLVMALVFMTRFWRKTPDPAQIS